MVVVVGGGGTCCSQFKVLAVTRQVLKVHRKLAQPNVPALLQGEAGRAASSTLRLSEAVVTSAAVFDNTARAQLTAWRHNGTNRRTSQAQTRCNFK